MARRLRSRRDRDRWWPVETLDFAGRHALDTVANCQWNKLGHIDCGYSSMRHPSEGRTSICRENKNDLRPIGDLAGSWVRIGNVAFKQVEVACPIELPGLACAVASTRSGSLNCGAVGQYTAVDCGRVADDGWPLPF